MILDSIGCASFHLSRDFTPASALLVDQLEDKIVFLHCPGFDHNARVELVVPPLAALFGDASRELGGNLAPVLGAIGEDILLQDGILLLSPASLQHICLVAEFKEALVALDH